MNEDGSEIVFLEGEKVILRPITKKDMFSLAKFKTNLEMRKLSDGEIFPISYDEIEKRWEKPRSGNRIDLSLAIKESDELIGYMNLRDINLKNRTASTATFIGKKTCWGKGYGTEARMLLLNYAFNTLNLRKINVYNSEFNKRSWNLSLKLGFKEEGRLKKQIFEENKYWDKILLGLFKEDWLPIWEKYKKEHDIKTKPLKKAKTTKKKT